MIKIDLDRGYLILSRCEFLYRNGAPPDPEERRRYGDGDIPIPLPPYFAERHHGPSADGPSAEAIVAAIRRAIYGTDHNQA